MIRKFSAKEGFALPTILIASVIMLFVLVSSVTATASVRSALDQQYYNQLAREAAESGLALAQLCLQYSGYQPTWTSSYPLKPDKDCTGVNDNGASHWIINQGNVRTTVTVGAPYSQTVSQLVTATATVELLRTSNSQPWRTYSSSSSARIGVDLSLNTVAFGYAGGYGAFFGTVAADGSLKTVGFNGWGQLGNGTFSNTLTPTKFQLNGNDKPVSVYTNFVSQGYDMFVVTDKGTVWGAGYNGNGQLGDGTTSSKNIAVQFGLPAGVKGTYVNSAGFNTYVLGDNSNIYAAGSCGSGMLGYNYTIAGCSDQSTYKRVALPTPTSDQNTIPTNNIVSDYLSTFVRMRGGRVYGWGDNGDGQFANGTTTGTAVPIQIGTFGDSGQPTATQIATDGVSLWVLDSSGKLWGSGYNNFGQLAGDKIALYNPNTSKCIDNNNGDGLNLQFYACLNNVNQQFSFLGDNSIYYPNKNKCLDNANGDGVTLRLWVCNGTGAQKFILRDDGSLYNPNTNKCFDNNGNGALLKLYACNGLTYQYFTLPDSKNLVQFALPPVAGTPVKIATDQWYTSVLTSNGQVWSAGVNNAGQLGNGSTSLNQPYPVQFILPNGVTATDVFVSSYSTTSETKYNNTFVIGSDGKVYGAGSNYFGQLGDGTTTNRSTPVAMQVIDGTNIKALQVQSGYGTTVVLTDNHKVYTVGNNGNGQLGDGTTTNSSVPKANAYTNILPVTIF